MKVTNGDRPLDVIPIGKRMFLLQTWVRAKQMRSEQIGRALGTDDDVSDHFSSLSILLITFVRFVLVFVRLKTKFPVLCNLTCFAQFEPDKRESIVDVAPKKGKGGKGSKAAAKPPPKVVHTPAPSDDNIVVRLSCRCA